MLVTQPAQQAWRGVVQALVMTICAAATVPAMATLSPFQLLIARSK